MDELAATTLLPLDQVPAGEVERVLDAAFGPDRRQRTAYAIRQGAECLSALCFAALDPEGALRGTIQAFPVALTDPAGTQHPLIMVGPVAIMPGHQGQGFGRGLMAAQGAVIEAVRDQGAMPLPQVLIGDAPYYGRFGFTEAPRGWRCPGPWQPERLLARSLANSGYPAEGMLGPWSA